MTLYRVARDVLVFLSRTLFRLQLVHGERVPRTGAYVLAPSHRSYLDTPFVASVTRRRIRFNVGTSTTTPATIAPTRARTAAAATPAMTAATATVTASVTPETTTATTTACRI